MGFKVNDRRRAAETEVAAPAPQRAGDAGGVTLEDLRRGNPEQTYQALVGALRGYLRGKMSFRDDGKGKTWCSGLTIPDPNHALVDEIARYMTEGVLRSGDNRAWSMRRVVDLQTGDVINRYITKIVHGKPEPVDYEASVLWVKAAPHKAGYSLVKVQSDGMGFEEFEAESSFLFFAHSPDVRIEED